MDRWKAEMGRVREEKRREEKKEAKKKRPQKKEDPGARNGRKVAKNCFFQWFVAPEGRKVGSLKAAGAEPAGQMRDEKLRAVLARSTFLSQNAQSTPGPDHFWKLWWLNSARRCGAKHMSKSKCTKHTRFGPLLEVEMMKKCTPLWREAHLEVKCTKHTRFGPLLEVIDDEKVHAVVARSTFPSQNAQSTPCSDIPCTAR